MTARGLALALAALSLAGCAQTRLRMDTQFGDAITQDLAAQVADPDAARNAGPAPATNGQRMVLSVDRYRTGQVIAPDQVGASGRQSAYGGNAGGAGVSGPIAGATGGPAQ